MCGHDVFTCILLVHLVQALSKNMDAIVVERESTAIEMAQFLSSNRAMLRETILPLDTLDPPQVKERLRQLGGTRKLVADVMTFDTKFTKVRTFCIYELLSVTLNCCLEDVVLTAIAWILRPLLCRLWSLPAPTSSFAKPSPMHVDCVSKSELSAKWSRLMDQPFQWRIL